jgi:hypothetical protein
MEIDKDTFLKENISNSVLPFEIIEDIDNVYIFTYIIPKDNSKEDLKKREKIIWEMYGNWCVDNLDKKCFNINLKSDIIVTFSGISETVEKSARNYKSTMAFLELDFVLKNAYKINEDKPHSKRQQKEYEKMLIMKANTGSFKPYFDQIKLIVGVKKNGRKNMYCITAIEKA